jgi:RNA polymerase sigma factor (sigma-70 family)
VHARIAPLDYPPVNGAPHLDFDDEPVVRAAQGGDRAAFGRLYQRYVRMVHGVLLARVPANVTEDLVHDVFLQALPRMKSLRDASRFGPWLAAIARNRAMDFHRRGKPDSPLDDQVGSIDGAQQSNGSVAMEDGMALLNAMRGLPEAYREPLILRRRRHDRTRNRHSYRPYTWLGACQSSSRHTVASRKVSMHRTARGKREKDMKNEYLWDGSGEPDPELQRLEESLAQFRHSGTTLDFPAVDSLQRSPSFLALLTSGWAPRLAAATLLILALVAAGLLLRISPLAPLNAPGWNVARLAGTPQVGHFSLASDASKAQLRVGQLLVTDSESRASLNVAEVGEVYVEPGSRVRLVETGSNHERLALELGTIQVAIWAPPGQFVVDTPSASAVDLGCAYTLQVNQDGSGTLHTTLGWVGFHRDGHDSFIPAGAMCLTRRAEGPGTPYFEDASQTLGDALHSLDFDSLSPEAREQSLRIILEQARPRDAFTLWHLLFRVGADERRLVYDRLSSLVKPPAGVTREGTLALNSQMLDAWWNAFDLGDISVWRFWEQKQGPPTPLKKASR